MNCLVCTGRLTSCDTYVSHNKFNKTSNFIAFINMNFKVISKVLPFFLQLVDQCKTFKTYKFFGIPNASLKYINDTNNMFNC